MVFFVNSWNESGNKLRTKLCIYLSMASQGKQLIFGTSHIFFIIFYFYAPVVGIVGIKLGPIQSFCTKRPCITHFLFLEFCSFVTLKITFLVHYRTQTKVRLIYISWNLYTMITNTTGRQISNLDCKSLLILPVCLEVILKIGLTKCVKC